MRLILTAVCCGVLSAQTPPAPESLSAWPYYKELTAHAGLNWFALDGEVLDKARTDGADLRLYDGSGREIPYLLRVRRDVDTRSLFAAREFNRAVDGGASVVSCDLGAQPQEHNEVMISTSGNNFRRLADVQGSPDGAQWFTLASQALLFRFTAGGRSAEQQAVSYPVSRYRYLRIRVERDPQVDHAPPEITSLAVQRSIQSRGEMLTFQAVLQGREAEPMQGRPASVYRLDLQRRIPLQSLTLSIGEPAFSRSFELANVDDPAAPTILAAGDLVRTGENAASPAQINFDEHFAHHLKLTIVDDRNAPLSLSSITAGSAMRQVIFESQAATVRLYYGNPKAIAPHYDAAARLPADPSVASLTLGSERDNPVYHPEPKPLSERSPWLVYIILVSACATLAAVLFNLARQNVYLAE